MYDVEEELQEFVAETFADEEIDMDYEFDAPRFVDLSRAETASEAGEADRWFEFAGNYPPSPFIIKLNWRKGIPVRVVNTFANSKHVEALNANNRDLSQSKAKCQVKSTVSRSSTLMKPTASHLAKQNHISITSLRLQKKLGIVDDWSSQTSSVNDNLATKRQKLEAGHSSKGAQLKHRAVFSHKVPRTVRPDGVMVNARPKATIPREPDLETAHRAERRRFRVNAEAGRQEKPMSCTFKARGTNRKGKYLPHCISHSKTTEGKRPNSMNSLRQEKGKTLNNPEAWRHDKKGLEFPTDTRSQDEPPIHLFSKLCLTSGSQENTNPRSKTPLPSEVTRERTRGSFFHEHKITTTIKGTSERLNGKTFGYCGANQEIQYKNCSSRGALIH